MALTLYSKAECHLCQIAHQILLDMELAVSVINIDSHSDLVAKYSLIIPVLVFDDGVELAWPFDAVSIQSQL